MRWMRRRSGVAGAAALCVAVLVLARGDGYNSFHAAAMLQLQQLTNWRTGVLGGKASLVTQCAKGDDAACDALVNDPGAVAALQHIDAKNPHGFAAKHPHEAATLKHKFHGRRRVVQRGPSQAQLKALYEQQQRRAKRPRRQEQLARARVPEPRVVQLQREAHRELVLDAKRRENSMDRHLDNIHPAKRVAEPLAYYGRGFKGVEKDYRTSAATKREWGLRAWKDGDLMARGTSPWLKSCAEGNYFACGQLNQDNDDVHDILHPHHAIHRAAKPKKPVLPKPVFVKRKHKGVLGNLMDAMGLGDTSVANTEVLRSVPEMMPDHGLTGRGTAAEYNDGTVGYLSDH